MTNNINAFNDDMLEMDILIKNGEIKKLREKYMQLQLEILRLRAAMELIKKGWWMEVAADVEGQAGMGTSVYYETGWPNTVEKGDTVVVTTKMAKVIEKHPGIMVLFPKDVDYIIKLKKGENFIKVPEPE